MNRLFDLNNPFWTFLGKLVDVFVLHVIWFVCSIPIVTFGASTTALYYALMKDVKDEEAHYVRSFFKSFKQNLKQGMLIGVILLLIGALLGFAFSYYYRMEPQGTFWSFAKAVTMAFIILYIVTTSWVFPYLARFDNTTRNVLMNSFFLSIRHLGWTILMVAIFIGVYGVVLYFAFLPLMILGYGLVAYLNSYILNHVFEPYIQEILKSQGQVEEDPDAWTVELPDEENAAAEEAAEIPEIPQAEEGAAAENTAEETPEEEEK